MKQPLKKILLSLIEVLFGWLVDVGRKHLDNANKNNEA